MASKRRVLILPSAEEEVEAIVSYLTAFSNQAARGFVEEYHSCSVNRYVLLYYREGDDIYIAHVFHQRQDYARLV